MSTLSGVPDNVGFLFLGWHLDKQKLFAIYPTLNIITISQWHWRNFLYHWTLKCQYLHLFNRGTFCTIEFCNRNRNSNRNLLFQGASSWELPHLCVSTLSGVPDNVGFLFLGWHLDKQKLFAIYPTLNISTISQWHWRNFLYHWTLKCQYLHLFNRGTFCTIEFCNRNRNSNRNLLFQGASSWELPRLCVSTLSGVPDNVGFLFLGWHLDKQKLFAVYPTLNISTISQWHWRNFLYHWTLKCQYLHLFNRGTFCTIEFRNRNINSNRNLPFQGASSWELPCLCVSTLSGVSDNVGFLFLGWHLDKQKLFAVYPTLNISTISQWHWRNFLYHWTLKCQYLHLFNWGTFCTIEFCNRNRNSNGNLPFQGASSWELPCLCVSTLSGVPDNVGFLFLGWHLDKQKLFAIYPTLNISTISQWHWRNFLYHWTLKCQYLHLFNWGTFCTIEFHNRNRNSNGNLPFQGASSWELPCLCVSTLSGVPDNVGFLFLGWHLDKQKLFAIYPTLNISTISQWHWRNFLYHWTLKCQYLHLFNRGTFCTLNFVTETETQMEIYHIRVHLLGSSPVCVCPHWVVYLTM